MQHHMLYKYSFIRTLHTRRPSLQKFGTVNLHETNSLSELTSRHRVTHGRLAQKGMENDAMIKYHPTGSAASPDPCFNHSVLPQRVSSPHSRRLHGSIFFSRLHSCLNSSTVPSGDCDGAEMSRPVESACETPSSLPQLS